MSESQLLAEPADVQMEDCEPSRDYEGGAEDAESSSSTYPSETEPRGRTSERFITWDQSTSKKEEQAESPTDQEDSRVRHNQKRMNQSCGTFENDDVQQGWSRSGEWRPDGSCTLHPGIPVDDWIKLLGGTITDVAATEECGWLAFYAALRNATEGFSPPTDTIIAAANDLKKQVLNGMIANLADEAKIHKADIDAEKHASGLTKEDISLADAGLCKLANHYAEQRRKSVDALVHKSFWVRAAHLKAMAMHAREQVFVLDVSPNGAARIQMYAYRDLSISPTERI
ncbi:hypothetical protein PC122_g22315 [Phytophthora cactorum]|nr:hypothetical protein PC122_g22315 [Phytophthora cactorum]